MSDKQREAFESIFVIPENSDIEFYPDREAYLSRQKMWKTTAKGLTDAWSGYKAAMLWQAAQQEAEPVGYVSSDNTIATVDGKLNLPAGTMLYTTPQPAKPVVPEKPTEKMLEAGQLALCGSIGGYESATILKAWEAMVAAAPQPDNNKT